MTKARVVEVLGKYKEILIGYGYSPRRLDVREWAMTTRPERLDHVLWMIETAKDFEEDRTEKAMRWLGFIQGALWCEGVRSVNQMKEDNMPKNEAFEGGRV